MTTTGTGSKTKLDGYEMLKPERTVDVIEVTSNESIENSPS